ncbi:MAG: hypothetical protein CL910_06180 [Deltaproteobacteria bacterium]|jgi:hypothetical protein|nr:hypothetical protein [Deltaproteobacteria bacterium]
MRGRHELFGLVAAGLLWAHAAVAVTPEVGLLPTRAPARLAAPAAGVDAWLEGELARHVTVSAHRAGPGFGPEGAHASTRIQVALAESGGTAAVVVAF